MRFLLSVSVTLAVLVITASAHAAPSTSDLEGLRDKLGSICTKTWKDEDLRRQLCQNDDWFDERLLLAIQKINTGRTFLDIRLAPTIVPKAGPLNEVVFVAAGINSICRGASTSDEPLREFICELRDRAYDVLSKRGICYGLKNQIGADMKWHRCTTNSSR